MYTATPDVEVTSPSLRGSLIIHPLATTLGSARQLA